MNFTELRTLVDLAEGEYLAPSKVSNTRARKHLMSIMKLCKEMRKEVLLKTKTPKPEPEAEDPPNDTEQS